MEFEEFIELEEIIQNFVDSLYKEYAIQLIVKFNRAVLGYDNTHSLYEYYVYFDGEVYDMICLLWNISEQKVENIISFRACKGIL